jgi:hypothetical protein
MLSSCHRSPSFLIRVFPAGKFTCKLTFNIFLLLSGLLTFCLLESSHPIIIFQRFLGQVHFFLAVMIFFAFDYFLILPYIASYNFFWRKYTEEIKVSKSCMSENIFWTWKKFIFWYITKVQNKFLFRTFNAFSIMFYQPILLGSRMTPVWFSFFIYNSSVLESL